MQRREGDAKDAKEAINFSFFASFAFPSRPSRPAARIPSEPNIPMARNTQVAADTSAPPITSILAKFVATHPGRVRALLGPSRALQGRAGKSAAAQFQR